MLRLFLAEQLVCTPEDVPNSLRQDERVPHQLFPSSVRWRREIAIPLLLPSLDIVLVPVEEGDGAVRVLALLGAQVLAHLHEERPHAEAQEPDLALREVDGLPVADRADRVPGRPLQVALSEELLLDTLAPLSVYVQSLKPWPMWQILMM